MPSIELGESRSLDHSPPSVRSPWRADEIAPDDTASPVPEEVDAAAAASLIDAAATALADAPPVDERHAAVEKPLVLATSMIDGCFDYGVFVEQLFVHLTWPLCLVPKSRRGQRGKNQFLTSLNPVYVVLNGMPLICLCMLFAFLRFNKSFTSAGVTADEVFLTPLFLDICRKAMVAVKYATLTARERETLLTETDPITVKRWQNQLQLLTGWMDLREDVLHAELYGAAAAIGIADLDSLVFYAERCDACTNTHTLNAEAWGRLTRAGARPGRRAEQQHKAPAAGGDPEALHRGYSERKTGPEPDIDLGEISVQSLIKIFQRAATAKSFTSAVDPRMLGLGLVLGLFPCFLRLVRARECAQLNAGWIVTTFFAARRVCSHANRDKPVPVLVSVVVVFMAVVTTVVGLLMLVFLFISVAHFDRTRAVFKWFSALVRPNFHSSPRIPQLQLMRYNKHAAHNVLMWMRVRALLSRFGLRYQRRIDIYATALSGAAMLLVARTLFLLFVSGGFSGDVNPRQRQALQKMRGDTFLWTSLYIFGMNAVAITWASSAASETNEVCESAASALSQHRLALHQSRALSKIAALEKKEVCARVNDEDDAALEEAFQVASEQLDCLNRVHALRIFGLPADQALVQSLVTTSVTVLGYTIMAIFGQPM